MRQAAHGTLSEVEKSSTFVFATWLQDKRVEKEIRLKGLETVKSEILNDLENIVGHGLSDQKYGGYVSAFKKANNPVKFMMFLGNAVLTGENLAVL